jgi:hypothetical protein
MRRLGYLAVLTMAALAPAAAFAAPPTLDKLGDKIRFLSLAEARAIALENSKLCQGRGFSPTMGFDSDGSPNFGFELVRTRVLAGGKRGSKSIVLTGIRRDPRPAEFECNVNQMLLNVENAYWNLYGSYYQLYSREQGLRFAYETWKITGAQFRVGRVSRAALAQAEGQYNLFRSQRLQTLDTVLDNERQLRAMMGMKIVDGERIVPSDAPTLVEKKPDWRKALLHALKHRPELLLSRQDVQLAAWKAEAAEEAQEIDSKVQRAEFQLERARQVLNDQELKAERFLGLYYRRMSSAYFQIKAARAQREAFATQLEIRYELYRAGSNEPGAQTPVSLDLLLESQRFWAEALATEYQAIVTYNNSLAGWEYAKGDMMKHARVRLGDEPAADDKTVRAVVREHKRTRMQVRRAPSLLVDSPLEMPTVPSLPMLWKTFPLQGEPLKAAH